VISDIPVPDDSDFPKPIGLYAKLAQVTGEIGAIEAHGFHDFLKTRYVTEADILEAVREKLAARNVVMLPSVTTIAEREAKVGKDKKDTIITTVRVIFTFCDGDTGESHSCEWAGSGEDPGDKGLSKAYTQALRYFLMKAFLVTADAEGAAKPPAAGTPRADGQAPINEEQYRGIVDAFKAAGMSETELHDILDTYEVPREVEGEMLACAHRVIRLSSLDAIKVHKALVAARAPEAAR